MTTHLNRNLVVASYVLLFHVAMLWALQSGLLMRAVELVVPVQLLSEFIEPPAPRVTPPPVSYTHLDVYKRQVLFQPNELHSYHFSAATSFNTSGDAYSLGASNANTPPEQSINVELGAKLDSADKRFTTRLAVFQSCLLYTSRCV